MIWVLIFYRYLIAFCWPCRTAQLFRDYFADVERTNSKNSTNTHPKCKSIASHPSPRYNCWVHNVILGHPFKMSSYKVKNPMQFTHDCANIIREICWHNESFYRSLNDSFSLSYELFSFQRTQLCFLAAKEPSSYIYVYYLMSLFSF